jgi:hypothetical protein
VGFPAIATGAVAESRNGAQTFRTASAAYVPITLTALSCAGTDACIAVGGSTLARITLLQPPVRHPEPARPHQAGSR